LAVGETGIDVGGTGVFVGADVALGATIAAGGAVVGTGAADGAHAPNRTISKARNAINPLGFLIVLIQISFANRLWFHAGSLTALIHGSEVARSTSALNTELMIADRSEPPASDWSTELPHSVLCHKIPYRPSQVVIRASPNSGERLIL
jgi:hypothetical protein